MKICSKCKEMKSLTEFYTDKTRKDGKHSHCKSCIKQHRQANREKIAVYQKEYNNQYRQSNKETIAERMKEYNQANRKKIAASKKKYYDDNQETLTAYQRKYYQTKKVARV